MKTKHPEYTGTSHCWAAISDLLKFLRSISIITGKGEIEIISEQDNELQIKARWNR